MQYNMIVRKKDKGYQVIISYKDGKRWRQKSKQGFVTQREAKIYGSRIVDDLKSTIISVGSNNSDITFLQFYKLFISEKQNITSSTRRTYDTMINTYCQPIWHVPIRNITHSDLIDLFNRYGGAVSSKNLCLVLLKAIFNYAINPYHLIVRSPCDAIKRFRAKNNKTVTTIPQDDLDRLLDAIRRSYPMYYMICSVARYTGARYGEILALTWEDVDLDHNRITINKQWAWLGSQGCGFAPPKSQASIRTVPIPESLAEELIWHKADPGSRLFPLKSNRSSPINRVIQRHLPGRSIHAFRHTYATTLLANGVDIQTVASLLGDNVNTVISTYIHYSEEMRRNASTMIANIFK